MNQRILTQLLVLTVSATFVAASVEQASAAPIQDRYIIQLHPGHGPSAVAVQHGLAPDFVYDAAINGFAGFVPPGRLKALQQDSRVVAISHDYEVDISAKPDSVMEASGKAATGGSSGTSQIVPEGVKRIGAAPGTSAYSGAGVGVAIVDTGLDFNHADLKPLGAGSYSVFGPSAQDDNGHGTHVGGTVAARNNSTGVVGVAPNAILYAVKVLDRYAKGADSYTIAGLDWVAANAAKVSPPIRVVNMSLSRTGTLTDNPTLRAAVQKLVYNGIAVVVSGGNDSSLEVSKRVPATYPEVLAIASTAALTGTSASASFPAIKADTASSFTTDGAFNATTRIGVTVSAPGENQENISSKGGITNVGILSTKLGGGTTQLYGTSMAAPLVTGVAALLYQKYGTTLTSEGARNIIILGATNPNAPLDSRGSGYTFDGDREGVLYAPGALNQ